LTFGAVLVDEGLPRRDDAGRVTSHGRHVSELHPLGITIQDGSQRGDLAGINHDQDRLASRDSIAGERRRAREELAVIGVRDASWRKPSFSATDPDLPAPACTDPHTSNVDPTDNDRRRGARGISHAADVERQTERKRESPFSGWRS
jgi:hypothetical protein